MERVFEDLLQIPAYFKQGYIADNGDDIIQIFHIKAFSRKELENRMLLDFSPIANTTYKSYPAVDIQITITGLIAKMISRKPSLYDAFKDGRYSPEHYKEVDEEYNRQRLSIRKAVADMVYDQWRKQVGAN